MQADMGPVAYCSYIIYIAHFQLVSSSYAAAIAAAHDTGLFLQFFVGVCVLTI